MDENEEGLPESLVTIQKKDLLERYLIEIFYLFFKYLSIDEQIYIWLGLNDRRSYEAT
jgi:hypothetical protein